MSDLSIESMDGIQEDPFVSVTLDKLQHLFLESNYGFCLIGRHRRIPYQSKGGIIDLLFYNRYAYRLIPVICRQTAYKTQYKGYMKTCLQGLKSEVYDHDGGAVGMVLCFDGLQLEVKLFTLIGKHLKELNAWVYRPSQTKMEQVLFEVFGHIKDNFITLQNNLLAAGEEDEGERSRGGGESEGEDTDGL